MEQNRIEINKEKQIEEMARDLCKNTLCSLGEWQDCSVSVGSCAKCKCLAERLVNAGYRKQSENVIELPCGVGDTIFVIRNDIIEQETVRGIKIGNCGLLLQVSKGVDDFEYHYEIEIGNKLFFAKEEAERR